MVQVRDLTLVRGALRSGYRRSYRPYRTNRRYGLNPPALEADLFVQRRDLLDHNNADNILPDSEHPCDPTEARQHKFIQPWRVNTVVVMLESELNLLEFNEEASEEPERYPQSPPPPPIKISEQPNMSQRGGDTGTTNNNSKQKKGNNSKKGKGKKAEHGKNQNAQRTLPQNAAHGHGVPKNNADQHAAKVVVNPLFPLPNDVTEKEPVYVVTRNPKNKHKTVVAKKYGSPTLQETENASKQVEEHDDGEAHHSKNSKATTAFDMDNDFPPLAKSNSSSSSVAFISPRSGGKGSNNRDAEKPLVQKSFERVAEAPSPIPPTSPPPPPPPPSSSPPSSEQVDTNVPPVSSTRSLTTQVSDEDTENLLKDISGTLNNLAMAKSSFKPRAVSEKTSKRVQKTPVQTQGGRASSHDPQDQREVVAKVVQCVKILPESQTEEHKVSKDSVQLSEDVKPKVRTDKLQSALNDVNVLPSNTGKQNSSPGSINSTYSTHFVNPTFIPSSLAHVYDLMATTIPYRPQVKKVNTHVDVTDSQSVTSFEDFRDALMKEKGGPHKPPSAPIQNPPAFVPVAPLSSVAPPVADSSVDGTVVSSKDSEPAPVTSSKQSQPRKPSASPPRRNKNTNDSRQNATRRNTNNNGNRNQRDRDNRRSYNQNDGRHYNQNSQMNQYSSGVNYQNFNENYFNPVPGYGNYQPPPPNAFRPPPMPRGADAPNMQTGQQNAPLMPNGPVPNPVAYAAVPNNQNAYSAIANAAIALSALSNASVQCGVPQGQFGAGANSSLPYGAMPNFAPPHVSASNKSSSYDTMPNNIPVPPSNSASYVSVSNGSLSKPSMTNGAMPHGSMPYSQNSDSSLSGSSVSYHAAHRGSLPNAYVQNASPAPYAPPTNIPAAMMNPPPGLQTSRPYGAVAPFPAGIYGTLPFMSMTNSIPGLHVSLPYTPRQNTQGMNTASPHMPKTVSTPGVNTTMSFAPMTQLPVVAAKHHVMPVGQDSTINTKQSKDTDVTETTDPDAPVADVVVTTVHDDETRKMSDVLNTTDAPQSYVPVSTVPDSTIETEPYEKSRVPVSTVVTDSYVQSSNAPTTVVTGPYATIPVHNSMPNSGVLHSPYVNTTMPYAPFYGNYGPYAPTDYNSGPYDPSNTNVGRYSPSSVTVPQYPLASNTDAGQYSPRSITVPQYPPPSNVNVSQYPPPSNVNASQYPPPSNVNASQYLPPRNVNASQYPPPSNVTASQYPPPRNVNASQYPLPSDVNVSQYPPQSNVNAAQYPPPSNVNAAQYPPPSNVNAAQYPSSSFYPGQYSSMPNNIPPYSAMPNHPSGINTTMPYVPLNSASSYAPMAQGPVSNSMPYAPIMKKPLSTAPTTGASVAPNTLNNQGSRSDTSSQSSGSTPPAPKTPGPNADLNQAFVSSPDAHVDDNNSDGCSTPRMQPPNMTAPPRPAMYDPRYTQLPLIPMETIAMSSELQKTLRDVLRLAPYEGVFFAQIINHFGRTTRHLRIILHDTSPFLLPGMNCPMFLRPNIGDHGEPNPMHTYFAKNDVSINAPDAPMTINHYPIKSFDLAVPEGHGIVNLPSVINNAIILDDSHRKPAPNNGKSTPVASSTSVETVSKPSFPTGN